MGDNRRVRVRRHYFGCGATAGLLLVGLGSFPAISDGVHAAPQSSTLPAEEAWFTDQAEAAGIDFVHVNGSSGKFYVSEILGSGAALVDFDNDGDLDVYIVQGGVLGPDNTQRGAAAPSEAGLLTDRLYRNDLEVHADGTRTLRFTDITEGSGLEANSYGMGVTAGDVNNDGWVDLYRTSLGANQLFRNNGDGTFTDVTRDAGTGDPRWSVSATFADVDRDGWLDLYVGNYLDHRLDARQPECFTRTGERDYCGPSAFASVPDRLYRNRGDGTFVDATAEAQVATEYGATLGVLAADLDADGWPDIYVANDGEPNQLWLNRRDGSFANGALLAGAALNGDGRTDFVDFFLFADAYGGTDANYGRQPAKMSEPEPADDAPDETLYFIYGILQGADACLRLYGHPQLLRIAEAINGPDFTPFADSIWIKEPGLGTSVAWHQDGTTHWGRANWDENIHGFNFMAQLCRTTPENALWVVPGSHKLGKIDIKARVDAVGTDRLPDAVPMLCEPGDVGCPS